MKQYEIGEEFEWDGTTYRVTEGECRNCVFYNFSCYHASQEDDTFPECDINLRDDKKDVIFELA